MDKVNKIAFLMAFLIFYVFDLVSTYIGLEKGAVETNIIFSYTGFYGTILIKTLFFIFLYFMVQHLDKQRPIYATYPLGIITGFGLMTVIINTGTIYAI